MKKIVISGSSSGIGRAITETLLEQEHHVLGLARHHNKFNPNNPCYQPVAIDFAAIDDLEKQLKPLAKANPDIEALICCTGFGCFGELEQFSVNQMKTVMNVNFLSQAILIKSFLPNLKRLNTNKNSDAKIIVIGSEAALRGGKKGSFYCASKFALRGFVQSLRQECTTANVAVTLINPGMVATPFFDDLSFQPGKEPENSILAQQIATTIELVINMRNNCVVEEINLQPLKKVISNTSPKVRKNENE